MAQGCELDSINNVWLQHENNIIASWHCEQKSGCPIVLWLSWLMVLSLLLAGVVLLIFAFVKYVVPLLSIFFPFLPRSPKQIKFSKQIKKSSRQKNEEETSDEPLGTRENPFKIPGRSHKEKIKGNVVYRRKVFKIYGNYVEGVFPQFEGPKITLNDSSETLGNKYGKIGIYTKEMIEATLKLRDELKINPKLKEKCCFTEAELKAIENGEETIPNRTWHHCEEMGEGREPILQLVDQATHRKCSHKGGSYTNNENNFREKYGEEWEAAKKRNAGSFLDACDLILS